MNQALTHTESKPKAASNNAPLFKPVIVQKKMSVGAENDSYEVEADAIADKVIQMNPIGEHRFNQTSSLVQKKCAHCEEEEKVRKKPLAETITPLIQKSSLISSNESQAPSHVETQINTTKGSGSRLDNHTRDYMEERFGVDFSEVRIHTNSQAIQMSQDLSAQAFTVGNDIYFNQGQYNPNSNKGKHLLAHELTHTVQQSGSQVKKLQKKSDSQTIQRNVFGDIGRGIARGASTAWDYTGGAAIRFGGRVIEWVEDRAEEIINEIAPGLLRFLRSSIWEPIRDMIARGLDAMTGGLFSRLQEEGLSGILHEFVDNIIETLQGNIADACRSFAQLAEKIFNFISSLSSSALARLKATFTKISGFFSEIWSDYGKPAMDAIKHYARAAWDWVVEKAQWLWDLIAPIRNAIQRAWNWIKRMFNIAWESATSAWDWLVEKATQAWEWIKQAIEPIKVPLMIIGGIIVLLSPLGIFAVIGAAVYGIYRAVQWVRANWNDEVFVRFRNFLQQNIFDPIQRGIQQLQILVNVAMQWLSGLFQQLQAAFQSLVNAVAQSSIFRFLRGIVQRVSSMIRSVTMWIVTQATRLGRFIADVAQSIWSFIRPAVVLVGKLIILANFPWLIPIVVMAWYWRLMPDCFKPPIINFVLRVMIGVLRAMPNFAMFGETWVQVKTRIVGFLQETLEKSDEEKITVANRVARMVSEMDLSLLSNQIAAAAGAPAEFEGQMEEELLGVNLTTALPFERTTFEEPSLQSQFQSSGLGDNVPASDAALFSRSEYTNQHIGVDSVGEFAPSEALQQAILSRTGTEDGTVEFGNSDDPSRTVHGILSEMIPSGPAVSEGVEGGIPVEENTPDFLQMTPEEETEFRLQQMIDQSNERIAEQACTPPSPEGASPEGADEAYPEEAKFGPLTRSQRGRYTMSQMASGMGHWWRCNRNWLIPTIIGVIIGVVLALVLTGGTASGALTAIAGVLMPIMIGVAVIRATYYLGEYVYKSINGDIAGASRALARGFAVAAVEAIFALLGSSAFWKSLKGGISGAGRIAGRGARALVRGTGRLLTRSGRLGAGLVRTVGAGSRSVLRTAGAVVTRGRVILQGIRGRIGSGIRTLEELGERLLARTRFRGFRIRIINRWFILEANINPWTIIMEGPLRGQIVEVDDLMVAGKNIGDDIFTRAGNAGTRMRIVSTRSSMPRSYRRIFEIFHGLPRGGSAGTVIHHLVEQQTRTLSNLITNVFLHGPANLRAIPRGFIEHFIHLSQIRIIWNRFYTTLHSLIGVGSLTERQMFQALRHFEIYTDDYIKAMLQIAEQNSHLSDDMLRALLETESTLWQQNRTLQQAISDAIDFGRLH
ncbi:eCIS core domain-containing protein [Flavobacterium sp. HNIBRBA15423]|uniref:eCIS core domain-containing protein n=1 Tax=Flavobacterium sp. HNIBRBA15423 TaxID=3458683 RepID=UPI004044D4BA